MLAKGAPMSLQGVALSDVCDRDEPSFAAASCSFGDSWCHSLRSLVFANDVAEAVATLHLSHASGVSPSVSKLRCILAVSADHRVFLGSNHLFRSQLFRSHPMLVAAYCSAALSSAQGLLQTRFSSARVSSGSGVSQPNARQASCSS